MPCTCIVTEFSSVRAVVLLCFWIEAVSITFPASRVRFLWRVSSAIHSCTKHVSREQSSAPGTVCVCERAQSHVVGPTQKIAVNLGANSPVYWQPPASECSLPGRDDGRTTCWSTSATKVILLLHISCGWRLVARIRLAPLATR